MDILSLTSDEMREVFKENSMQAYRAAQVYEWLHKHLVSDYDEMTNLPKDMRESLKEHFPVPVFSIERKAVSKDGTAKYLFAMPDGDYVESVVMKYKYGYTICVSSQVGCKMGCAFCASALGGFKRSLSAGEILSQVYTAQKDLGQRISHIVLMGMGEPFDNYENITRFITLITDEKGQNLSMRNISLSTCGVVPGIKALAQKKLQLTLSISLHAPNNEIRNRLMPVNKKYDIDELLSACKEYINATSRRISFEYAMIDGLNDSDENARELASRLRGMLCHVNLIPINEVKESPFKPSSAERIASFTSVLEKRGITVTVRRKLGSDIDASCGQLRLKEKRRSD